MADQEALEASPLRRHLTSLQGKVVMVTGASSGIGHDLCLDLGKAGCRVVAAARRADRLQSLCDEINRMDPDGSGGPIAAAVQLDISAGGKEVEAAVRIAWDAFGRIDALVNNAGIRGNVHSPLDLPEEEWDSLAATNLKGTWLVTKFVCRLMRDAKQKGSVINISSIAGVNRGHLPGGVAYVATKSGINAMSRLMALELGEHNIRVNSISPGLFKSEITEGLVQKEWLQRVNARIIPLKTNGTIDPALTSLIRYLIDDSSQYVSGNGFIVDSGATLPGFPIYSSL